MLGTEMHPRNDGRIVAVIEKSHPVYAIPQAIGQGYPKSCSLHYPHDDMNGMPYSSLCDHERNARTAEASPAEHIRVV